MLRVWPKLSLLDIGPHRGSTRPALRSSAISGALELPHRHRVSRSAAIRFGHGPTELYTESADKSAATAAAGTLGGNRSVATVVKESPVTTSGPPSLLGTRPFLLRGLGTRLGLDGVKLARMKQY